MSLLGQNQPPLEGKQRQLWRGTGTAWDLTDLETKAVYVAGMLRHLLESAGLCLRNRLHLPTYLLAVDATELLGAVVSGRTLSNDETVVAGLAYLIDEARDSTARFATTAAGSYTIRDCVSRRHFAAHGARQLLPAATLDAELTDRLLCHLAAGIDRWWIALARDPAMQGRLAIAKVPPLLTEGEVVFVRHLLPALLDGATPAGTVLNDDSWRGRCC